MPEAIQASYTENSCNQTSKLMIKDPQMRLSGDLAIASNLRIWYTMYI